MAAKEISENRRKDNGIILRAEGIRKSFGDKVVLRGVDLALHEGDRLVILGPNGAGKTTLMRILAGVLSFESGVLEVNGVLGYVPDRNPVFDVMEARELLDLLADEWEGEARSFGVDAFLDRRLRELSKGMLRRVLLAAAFARGRDGVLLDEPYNGLDPGGRELLRKRLTGAKTYIMTTHLVTEIPPNATRILLLHDGKFALSARRGENLYVTTRKYPDSYYLGENVYVSKRCEEENCLKIF